METFPGTFGKKDGSAKCSLPKPYSVAITGALLASSLYRDVGYKSLCDKFDSHPVLTDKCTASLKSNTQSFALAELTKLIIPGPYNKRRKTLETMKNKRHDRVG